MTAPPLPNSANKNTQRITSELLPSTTLTSNHKYSDCNDWIKKFAYFYSAHNMKEQNKATEILYFHQKLDDELRKQVEFQATDTTPTYSDISAVKSRCTILKDIFAEGIPSKLD